MRLDNRAIANWLIIGVASLWLLVVGRELLVPFIFAVLLWNVLNAITAYLRHHHVPHLLAWITSLALVVAAMYLVARILSNEAFSLASRGPVYIAKLEALSNQLATFLHLGPAMNLAEIASRYDVAGTVGSAVAVVGNIFFQLILVAIYVGFLLSEQRHLPAKLAKLTLLGPDRKEGREVMDAIARQVQAYLGVCTLLSAIMGTITYVVLTVLGIDFAGFWALVMFVLTYIPNIGAFGVVLPALMALVQFGTLGPALIVGSVLGAAHFVLASIVQTILLGKSLNLSPLAIIVSLTFWGLVWGVSGLFLAVPMTAAIAIICEHIEGVHWVATLLGGHVPRRVRRRDRLAKGREHAHVPEKAHEAAHHTKP